MISTDSNTKIQSRQLKPKKNTAPQIFVFILGLSISILTLGISNNSKIKDPEPVKPAVPQTEEEVLSAPIKFTYFDPLFGEIAVYRCNKACEAKSSDFLASCQDSCNQLHVVYYGKRSYNSEKDIVKDANETFNRCKALKVKFPNSPSRSNWELNTEKIAKSAVSYEEQCEGQGIDFLRSQINILVNTANLLNLPSDEGNGIENEATFINNVSSLLCLNTSINAAKLGINITEKNSDKKGEAYYKGFIENMKPKVVDLKKVIQKQSVDLKFKLS